MKDAQQRQTALQGEQLDYLRWANTEYRPIPEIPEMPNPVQQIDPSTIPGLEVPAYQPAEDWLPEGFYPEFKPIDVKYSNRPSTDDPTFSSQPSSKIVAESTGFVETQTPIEQSTTPAPVQQDQQPLAESFKPPPVNWKAYKSGHVMFTSANWRGSKNFVYPVDGGEIRLDDVRWNKHRGVDIFQRVGTPIKSPWSGTIIYAQAGGTRNTEDSDPTTPGYQPQHSIKLKLDQPQVINGKRVAYLYLTHLSALNGLKPGQKVKAGQVLGRVGSTGNEASSPGAAPDKNWGHLHFAIGETEDFRDPNPYGYMDTVEMLNLLRTK